MERRAIILFFVFFIASAILAIDPMPGRLTTIKIVDNSIATIDSFFIEQSTNDDYNRIVTYYRKDVNEPIKIRVTSDSFRVKFLLLDSSILYSEYINIGESSKNLLHIISVNRNSVFIEKSYSSYILNIVWKVLFVLLMGFTFKVLPFVLKLEIRNKIKYIVKYMIINSLYVLLVIPFMFLALFSFGIALILYPFLLYLFDKEIHKNDTNVLKSENNVFLIITNVIFSIVVCTTIVIYSFTSILNL